MTTTLPADELARDVAFLLLAEDDDLARLGFAHATIHPRTAYDRRPVDRRTDGLVLTWSIAVPVDDVVRQRVVLSVHGPSARSDRFVHRALSRAGRVLTDAVLPRPPLLAVLPSAPRRHRAVAGDVVPVGFEVVAG